MGKTSYTSSLALGIALFSSASASVDDCQNREMIMVPPSLYYETGSKDASATDVCSYISNSPAPKADDDGDDGLVWLPVPSIPKKMTKNFHFLGKKKYETTVRPKFFT